MIKERKEIKTFGLILCLPFLIPSYNEKIMKKGRLIIRGIKKGFASQELKFFLREMPLASLEN